MTRKRVYVRSVAVGALIGWGGVVSAAAPDDWYAAITVGTGYAEDGELAASGLRTDYDQGWPVGGIAIGARFSDRLRVELEASYRSNDYEILYASDGSAQVNPDPEDRIDAVSLMANMLFDFRSEHSMRPYLGVGVGTARLDYQAKNEISRVPVIDDDPDAFAFQLIGGFTFEVSPRLDVTADYRYWRTESFELTDARGRSGSERHTVHTTMLGARYHLRPRPHAGQGSPSGSGPAPGWYVAAAGGGAFAKDANVADSQTNYDAFGPGPSASVAVGFARGPSWRFELEGSVHRNDVELLDYSPDFEEDRTTGELTAVSLMANVYYDFAGFGEVRPYMGIGLGGARAEYDVQTDTGTFVDDRSTAAAAQLLLGARSAITERATVTLAYRLWGGREFELTQADGGRLKNNQLVHAVQVGVQLQLR
jgi:opacity protein-like surface antigen